jgi:Mycothiol maleylpyruvate isomerase N-terminal domain
VLDPLDARAVVLEAGDALATVVDSLDVHRLDEAATDAWTLRELVAHALRGLLTIETTVAAPVDPSSRDLGSAAGYFALARSVPTVHAGIEQRARDAAAALHDPHGDVVDALARVSPIVERTPLDREVQHLFGRLRFDQYLVTRIVELTLHTADIQLAVGESVAFPDAPSAVTRDALLGLVGRADALAVACVLAGRGGPRCNVLG